MEYSFDGRATIRVKFNNRAEYEKFRIYVLKTKWSYDLDYPLFEEMKMEFHCVDDLNHVNKQIVYLLQLGFEVYCCRYQMEQTLSEEEYPLEYAEYDEPAFETSPNVEAVDADL